MKAKTKKNITAVTKQTVNKEKAAQEKSFFPLLFVLLYAAVDLVPQFGATDVMGSQWLYLSIIDLLCIVYFFLSVKENDWKKITQIFSSTLTLVYIGLFILSGLSIFVALNKVESLVCYARFAVALIAYFNLAILLHNRLQLLRFIAIAFTVLLLFQSIQVLSAFFKGYGEVDLNELILGLKGNAGNKNILAASLVIKIPFTLYCIYTSRIWMQLFCATVITIAVFAIAILNARASFVSILLISSLYIIFCMACGSKNQKKKIGVNIAFLVIPLAIGVILSQITLQNALTLQTTASGYGTVAKRLGTIGLTEEASDYRFLEWRNAIDFIKHHPFTGAGYGNWKLASIPYERTFSNDLLVTYHVHNDFLEFSAETGLLGGLLLISIFAVAIFYVFKVLRLQNASGLQTKAAFILMALAVYFIDAFLNFPTERPITQFFLSIILALILNIYLQSNSENEKSFAINLPKIKSAFTIIACLLLIPSTWFTYTTYKSMVAQATINLDMLEPTPAKTWEEVNKELPQTPNLNVFCFPIDAIKARYLLNEKKYNEALNDLNKSAKANPYLPYTEFLKAQVFWQLNKIDSARFYADVAFTKRPRSLANLQLRNFISYQLKDTNTLNETFRVFTSYRKDQPEAWNNYLNYLYNLTHDTSKLKTLLDSALKLYPDNKELQQKMLDISASKPSAASLAAAPYIKKGLEAFDKKEYALAIQNFIGAGDLNPKDYTIWENAAICFYLQNNYKQASFYFDKAIDLQMAKDGKSEFYKALCLGKLGDSAGACNYFQLAAAKNYADAKKQIELNCK